MKEEIQSLLGEFLEAYRAGGFSGVYRHRDTLQKEGGHEGVVEVIVGELERYFSSGNASERFKTVVEDDVRQLSSLLEKCLDSEELI